MRGKQILALFSSMAMIAGIFSGCGLRSNTKVSTTGKEMADDDLSEHVELTLGGINLGNSNTKVWPTEVVKQLEDKFNVTLTVKSYDKESLNLDLSGGTTSDIVQINDEHIEGVLKGKHAVNLEAYKEVAPNIFSDTMTFRNNVMKGFKSKGEDAQYFVTPRVASEDLVTNFGVNLSAGYVVRWDLYKAIGYPEIKDDDDYIKALKDMKELYPETEEGLPVYAMSAYNDAGLHTYFYKGCLSEGYVNLEGGIYVQNAVTNELLANVYDEANPDVLTPFWAGIKFYNQLYREGLLDPDCFITKSEDLTEKYTKGQYLGGTVNWYFGNYNGNQRVEDKETLKQFVVLPSKLGWANEKDRAGWSGKYFYVSSHSPNIQRAVKILDYLQSEEFSRNTDSGVEGRWKKGEGGKPHLTEDTIIMKTDPSRSTEWEQSGIGESNMRTVVGLSEDNRAADGGRINLWYEEDVISAGLTYAEKDMCETLNLTLPSDLLKKGIEKGANMDLRESNSEIRMCMETTPRNILRIDSDCQEITINAVPSLVQAKTDEEFEAAKVKLMSSLKGANAEASVKWWQEAWEISKSAIEKLEE